MMNNVPHLTVKNLIVGYDGNPVLSNLSFTVNMGDYLCSAASICRYKDKSVQNKNTAEPFVSLNSQRSHGTISLLLHVP
jgi:formate dehydrogenase maturation protein FdhE